MGRQRTSKMIFPVTSNMDCNALCKAIQKVFNRYNKEVEQTVPGVHALSVNVVKISDGGDDHIPKIEDNNNGANTDSKK